MATKTVTNTLVDPSLNPIIGAKIRIYIRPTNGFRKNNWTEVGPLVDGVTNGFGVWSIALECNDNITPDGTYYVVYEEIPSLQGGSLEWAFLVTSGLPSPVNLHDILTDPLSPVGSGNGYLTEAEADALFLTQAEADLLYDPLGSGGGGSGGPQSYVFNQGTPAITWTITHGLPFVPNVTVVDSSGAQVEGDIVYSGPNVIVSFATAFSGKAYLS
jgi:hypothetical protein